MPDAGGSMLVDQGFIDRAPELEPGTPALTRADGVFAQLRVDILTGRFPPGEKLRFAHLTERYGASTTVVREGLSRLAEIGLVVAHPQQGFRVRPLSVRDLLDLTQARCDIESITLRYAIAHGGLPWESELVAATHTLERTATMMLETLGTPREREVSLAWATARRNYHTALFAGCPNLRLQAFCATMRDAGELYRIWMPPIDTSKNPTAEHRACVDAALAGDADLSAEVLRQHVQGMCDLMISLRAATDPDAAAALEMISTDPSHPPVR